MSPTSYQTAPPRDNREIIGRRPGGVKPILNKINNLQKALILLGLSLERCYRALVPVGGAPMDGLMRLVRDLLCDSRLAIGMIHHESRIEIPGRY